MAAFDWLLLGLRVLSTLILYTFLGLAFYLIWRDLKRAESRPETLPQARPHLRVIAPAHPAAPDSLPLVPLQPVTLLGRNPDNTVTLDDEAVSGRHARISQKNGVWWLEDLGSRNGTRLNDLPLSRPATLADGDLISIGHTHFRLELGQSPPGGAWLFRN